MKLKLLSTVLFVTSLFITENVSGSDVTITMNTVSPTMTLISKDGGGSVTTGAPDNRVYNFEAVPGNYILTAYATDGATVNGTIELEVTDGTNSFTVLTSTAYVTNSSWTPGTDYIFDVTVNSREGKKRNIGIGQSTTSPRLTFPALSGDSYTATFTPTTQRVDEGFTTLYKGGTLTSSGNITGAVPASAELTVTVPDDAQFVLGIKFVHFADFTIVGPAKEETSGGVKTLTYSLAASQQYNFRAMSKGGITHAGYFTMSADVAKQPKLAFSAEDFNSYDPHKINHDPTSNKGYETGDIFLNINPTGHLAMYQGGTYDLHAMRTWELTDNVVNNYFIEPDFNFSIYDVNGNPLTGVIEIIEDGVPGSAWRTIKAVGKGTAVVTVSYDAIRVNSYNTSGVKTDYAGGEYWGAIWPENTGVFVVTVDEDSDAVSPNMTINEDYNSTALKMAGDAVDAEHDVFYFLDDSDGFPYTFTPDGVQTVTLSYPVDKDGIIKYTHFGSDGVIDNNDGSYTVLLRHGRQIVRLTDTSGNAAYQVLTAKECHRDITNLTHVNSDVFYPGDQVQIQYSGLFHPANKIAGIYNMSAYVTYNGTPNGSSLIQGSSQYTFGSAPAAQAVTVTIPETFDVSASPEFVMDDGVIQVNGFGDPIGNHRNTSRVAGRSPNFAAAAHKTYFGALPEVRLKVVPSGTTSLFGKKTLSDTEEPDVMFTGTTASFTNTDRAWIYDLSGRILLTVVDARQQVALTNLLPGVYIVKMQKENIFRSVKVIL